MIEADELAHRWQQLAALAILTVLGKHLLQRDYPEAGLATPATSPVVINLELEQFGVLLGAVRTAQPGRSAEAGFQVRPKPGPQGEVIVETAITASGTRAICNWADLSTNGYLDLIVCESDYPTSLRLVAGWSAICRWNSFGLIPSSLSGRVRRCRQRR